MRLENFLEKYSIYLLLLGLCCMSSLTIQAQSDTLITQAEVDSFKSTLGGSTVFAGDLTIGEISNTSSSIIDLSPLNFLTEIGGFFEIRRIESLQNMGNFSNLRKIGGRFLIFNNDALDTVSGFPVLDTLGGAFQIIANARLMDLGDYASLRHIGGDFIIGDRDGNNDRVNGALTDVGDFPVLTTLLGNFNIYKSNKVNAFSGFPSLNTLGGYFEIIDNERLEDLGDYTSLRHIGGYFLIRANDALTNVGSFPRLATVGEYFSIRGNENILDLYDFPALTSIGMDSVWVSSQNDLGVDTSIVIENNPKLASCCVLTKFHSGGIYALSGIHVNNNAGNCNSASEATCAPVNLTTQAAVNDFRNTLGNATAIVGNLIIGPSSNITNLDSLRFLTEVTGSFEIKRNSALTRIGDFPDLRRIGKRYLLLGNDALDTVSGFSVLDSLRGDFYIIDNEKLSSLGNYASLRHIGGDFIIGDGYGDYGVSRSNPSLEDLGNFSQLRMIKGFCQVYDNISLVNIVDNFPSLERILGGVSIAGNRKLETVDISSSLQFVGGSFFIGRVSLAMNPGDVPNPSLVSLNFSSLDSVRGNFGIRDNGALVDSIDFSSLTTITGDFSLVNNASLKTTGLFPQLRTVDGNFEIQENPLLVSLNFSSVDSIGGNFGIRDNGALVDSIDFSSLTTITGDFSLVNNASLKTTGLFPQLRTIGADFEIQNNPLLGYCCGLSRFLSGESNTISGTTIITNNALGCDNEEEINCDAGSRLSSDTLRLPFDSISTTFILYSPTRWKLSRLGTADWLTGLSLDGGSTSVANDLMGDGTTVINLSYTQNDTSGESRTIRLLISSINESGTVLNSPVPDTLTLIQEENPSILESVPIEVNVQHLAGSARLIISSDQRWRLRKSDPATSWITMLSYETTSVADSLVVDQTLPLISVTITYDEISTSVSRSATLTLEAVDNEDNERNFPPPVTITITQAGIPVFTEDLTLTIQEQVDNIRTTLGISTVIEANLIIGPSSNITDLSPLNFLTEVGGNIIIQENSILDRLADFDSLRRVGGGLDIMNNPSLTYTGKFPVLKNIGGRYLLDNNDALLVAEGFPVLDTLNEIFIINNTNLDSLGEYSSLRYIKTNYIIGDEEETGGRSNPSLVDLGSFPQLRDIGGHYQVFNSDSLVRIVDNFPSLERIENGFEIAGNEKLETIDFSSSLQFVGGNFIIGEVSYGGYKEVSPNPSLVSLDFSLLNRIRGDFEIRDNDALVDKIDFSSLTAITGSFSLIDNSSLKTTGLFPQLRTVGAYFEIQDNPLLGYCCGLSNFLSSESAVSGTITIRNNALGCNNEEEVNCDVSSRVLSDTLRVLPSSTDTTFILYSLTRWKLSLLDTEADWLTGLSLDGGTTNVTNDLTGEGTAFINLSYTQHLVIESRTVRLLISSIDESGTVLDSPVPDTLTLIQKGAVPTLELQSPVAVNVGNDNGSVELNLRSNLRWRLRKSDPETSWITMLSDGTTNVTDSLLVDQSAIVLSEITTVTVTYDEAPTSVSRSAVLDLAAIDNDNNELDFLPSVTITITQAGYMSDARNITLTTQAEVNAIRDRLGDLRNTIVGNLTIGGIFYGGSLYNDITNLDSLNFLTEIRGNFFIGNIDSGNPNLINIGDFPVLRKIGGNYRVIENPKLVDGGRFPVLDSIGGYFSVRNNEKLTSVGSYPSLVDIGRYFSINSNDRLRYLYDFPALMTIRGRGALVPSNPSVSNAKIVIEQNSSLEYCCVLTKFRSEETDQEVLRSGGIYISDNATGCTEIKGACDPFADLSVEDTIRSPFDTTETTFTITSNTRWRLNKPSADADWVTMLSAGTKNHSDSVVAGQNDEITYTSVTVSYRPNGTYEPRTVNLLVSFLDEMDVVSQKDTFLTLIQEARKDILQLQSPNEVNVSHSNESTEINIRSNVRWQLRKPQDATWITNLFTGSNNDADTLKVDNSNVETSEVTTVTIEYEGVPTSLSRSAELVLVAVDENGHVIETLPPVTITITQAGFRSYTGDITLTTQAEVNAIRDRLGDPRISTIKGNLTIGLSSNITHLDSLYFLTEITGDFFIGNTNKGNADLVDIGNFPFLQKIGGNYYVTENTELVHGGNFPVLESIGGYLFIQSNDKLEHVGYFPSLTNIGSGSVRVPSQNRNVANTSIVIEQNPLLKYCCVLTNFRSGEVSGDVYLSGNASGCNTIGEANCDFSVELSSDTLRVPFYTTDTAFFISSNTRWRLSKPGTGADWVRMLSAGGETSQDSVMGGSLLAGSHTPVRVNYQHNTTSSVREVGLFVSFLDETDVATPADTLTIIQEGRRELLQLESSDSVNVSYVADSAEIRLRSNVRWQLRKPSGATWITSLSTENNSDADTLKVDDSGVPIARMTAVTITYDAVPTSASRSTTLSLVAIDEEGTALSFPPPVTIVVTQSGIPVYPRSVTLKTQADVNDIRTRLGGAPIIGDNLTIGPSNDITNLDSLNFLIEVRGNFEIKQNKILTHIGDFPSLRRIEGRYIIFNNNVLETVSGFSGLDSLGTDFHVIENAELVDLGDYGSLRHINGSFIIGDSPPKSLPRINPSLKDIGSFPVLTTLGGTYIIYGNESLEVINGFPSLDSSGDDFEIRQNLALTRIGDFPNLKSIGGDYLILNNNMLVHGGNFPMLDSIRRSFFVVANEKLTDVGFFPNLRAIGEYLSIRSHDNLRSLYEFPALTSIGMRNKVWVPSSNSGNGGFLDGVSIVVEYNSQLEYCCVLTRLRAGGGLTISGDRYISNNFEGCNSIEMSSCDLSVRLSVEDTIILPFYAMDTTFTIHSNARWRLSKLNPEDAGWITSLSSGGEHNSDSLALDRDATITVHYGQNISNESRTVKFILSFIDEMGHVLTSSVPDPDTLTFIQNGNMTILELSPVNASYRGGDVDLRIRSNKRWRLRKSDPEIHWITMLSSEDTTVSDSITGGVDNFSPSDVMVTVSYQEVPNANSRFTELVLMAFDEDSTELFIPFTQLGYPSYMSDLTLTTQIAVDTIRKTLGNDPKITSIGGNLTIGPSDDITNLDSLRFLTEITGDFNIGNTNEGNSALVDIGDFPFLQKIGGGYYVTENTELVHGGNFPVLDSIGGYFFIRINGKLESLGTFPHLKDIGSYISIRSNDRLRSLYEFPALTSIGMGSAWVPSLSSIDRAIVDSVSIVIEQNSLLEYCCVLTRLREGEGLTISGDGYIGNNFEGCNIKEGNDETNCDLSIRLSVEDTLMLPFYTMDTTVIVFSNTRWQLRKLGDDDWITMLSSGEERDSEVLVGEKDVPVMINYDQNPLSASRTANFLISFVDETTGVVLVSPTPDTLTFIQQGVEPTIQLLSDTIKIPYLDGSADFSVFSNTRWQLRKSNPAVDWVTMLSAEGISVSDSLVGGDSTLFPSDVVATINYQETVNSNTRFTHLVLVSLDEEGMERASSLITIIQEGFPSHISDVTLTTQEQVDSIHTTLGNAKVTAITGNLTVGPSSDITHLDSLRFLTEIGGNFEIKENSMLENIGDFPMLKKIKGNYVIFDNDILEIVKGLSVLDSLGGDFHIIGNGSLDSLGYYGSLRRITGNFIIGDDFNLGRPNPSLKDLGNFSMLEDIGGNYQVYHNDSLVNLVDNFPLLERVEKNFQIARNMKLANISAFTSLRNIGGNFQIGGNSTLESNPELVLLDFSTLSTVDDTFEIINNDMLVNAGDFSMLETIGGNVLISDNERLKKLDQFTFLKMVDGNFVLSSNDSLTSLNFSVLDTIKGHLQIHNNNFLDEISFITLQHIGKHISITDNENLLFLGKFPNLNHIGSSSSLYVPSESDDISDVSILVENNPKLFNCCLLDSFLLEESNEVTGDIYISNNFLGCNSKGEINCDIFSRLLSDTLRVPFDSTSTTFMLHSPTRWKLSRLDMAADWFTGFSLDGENTTVTNHLMGEGTALINLSYTQNDTSESRTIRLLISSIDVAGDVLDFLVPDTLTLIQEENTSTLESLPIEVEVQHLAGSEELRIISDTRWRLRKSDPATSWITMLSYETTSVTDSLVVDQTLPPFRIVVMITYDETPISVSRSATLTLEAVDNENNKRNFPPPVTITITQSGIPVYSEDLTLTTQQAVDTIRNMLGDPRITVIAGNLTIGRSNDITDLSPLNFLTEVRGNIIIQENSILDSLADFDSLRRVGGGLDIKNNPSLTYTGKFPVLKSIGGRYLLDNNDALLVAEGFPMLDTLGEIFIINNTNLDSLGEYDSLRHIKTNYIIGDEEEMGGRPNPSLVDLGSFSQLRNIGGHYQVFNSDSLVHIIDNFPSLERIENGFEIAGNEKLETIDFSSSLQFVGGNFIIGEVSYGGYKEVSPNPSLVSLDFSLLNRIRGDFGIRDNDALVDKIDFSSLTAITGSFSLIDNSSLKDVGLFSQLRTIGADFEIQDNPLLGYCCGLSSFLSGESAVSGTITIRNNALGCNSEGEINCGIFSRLSSDVLRVLPSSTNTNFILYSSSRWKLSRLDMAVDWFTGFSLDGGTTSVTNDLMGEGTTFINLSYAQHFAIESRMVRLLISSVDVAGKILDSPIPDTLTLIQEGTGSILELQSPVAVNVGYESGNVELTPRSNLRWRLRKSDPETSWITMLSDGTTNVTDSLLVDQSDLALSEITTVTVTYDGASTSVSRSAVLDLAAIDNDNNELDFPPSVTITITQDGYLSYEGDITLTTQQAVDTIRNTLGDPRIIAIAGNLIIGGSSSNITHLDSLYFLAEITGNFFIGNTDNGNSTLINVGDFPFLRKIGGNYLVTENTNLVNAGRFPVLDSIGGYFLILNNEKLTSVGSYPSLVDIGGYFSINSNDRLRYLYDFPSLTNIGLGSVRVPSQNRDMANTSIVIEQNPLLKYCCVLTEFRSGGTYPVSGDVYISGNAAGCNTIDEASCDFSVELSSDTLRVPFYTTDTTFFISSNTRWRLHKPNADWVETLSVGGEIPQDSVMGGSLLAGSHTPVRVNYQHNTTSLVREVGLFVSFLDETNVTTPSDTLTVIQEGRRQFLQLESSDLVNVSHLAGSTEIHLRSNVRWQLRKPSEATWITSLSTGSNNDADTLKVDDSDVLISRMTTVTITYDTIPTLASRSVTLSLVAIDEEGTALEFPISVMITITQSGIPVYSEDVILKTQAEVNDIRTMLGSAAIIDANLTIGPSSDITHLDSLNFLTKVTGNFEIRQNSALTHIGDFSNLRRIGGKYLIFKNNALETVNGFSVLDSLGTDFHVIDNMKLMDLGNYGSLRHINGSFIIGEPSGSGSINPSLVDLGDFSSLNVIGGYYQIYDNDRLVHGCNFPMLDSIRGYFLVLANEKLTDVGFFPNLKSIGGYLSISSNDSLRSLYDFPSLTNIGSGRPQVPSQNGSRDNTSIVVDSNPLLEYCCVLTRLREGEGLTISGDSYISNNFEGCNISDDEDETSCDLSVRLVNDTLMVPFYTMDTTFTIYSNAQWRLSKLNSEDSDWITSLSSGGERNSDSLTLERDATITVHYEQNFSNRPRTVRFILSFIDEVGHVLTSPVPDTLTFIQSENITTLELYSPSDSVNVSYRDGDVDLLIRSNKRWRLRKLDPATHWITMLSSEGTDVSDSIIGGVDSLFPSDVMVTVNYQEVPNANSRFTALVLMAFDEDSTELLIPFTQSGYPSYTKNLTLTTQQAVDTIRKTLGNDKVTAIGGNLTIGPSDDITHLDSLYFLTEITGDFNIGNTNLVDIGDFPFLQEIGGDYYVTENTELVHGGNFPLLDSIGGYFFTLNHERLTDVGSYPNLKSIGGYLSIRSNDSLRSLYDFPSLTNIGYDSVRVPSQNRDIANTSIVIEQNLLLEYCCVLTRLREGEGLTISGDSYISNNFEGCNIKEGKDETNCDLSVRLSVGYTIMLPFYTTDTTFTIFSNTRWQLNKLEDVDWITSLSSGEESNSDVLVGEKDAPIMINYDQNSLSESRTTNLLISFVDEITGKVLNSPVPVPDTLTFIQQGVEPTIQLLLDTIKISYLDGSVDFSIFSNTRWRLHKSNPAVNWVTMLSAEGTSVSDSLVGGTETDFPSDVVVTINYQETVNSNTRFTHLVLVSFDDEGMRRTYSLITIIQEGFPFHMSDVTLTTQEQVDSIHTTLGNEKVTAITGNLTVGPSANITDLSPLNFLTEIGGNLEIKENSMLENIGDFPMLKKIKGNYVIFDNDILEIVKGLSALDSLGGDFHIIDNESLDSLGYYGSLRRIAGNFIIGDNFNSGRPNPSLKDLGDFSMLETIGGNVLISDNERLKKLDQFTFLKMVDGNFVLSSNDSLISLNFSVLDTIKGHLQIHSNNFLDDMSFSTLKHIGKHISITNNENLLFLGKFPDLNHIGSSLSLYVPSELKDLSNVSILVENNPKLFNCCLLDSFLLEESNEVAGDIYVNNNFLGCNSIDEANCDQFILVTTQTEVDSLVNTIGNSLRLGHVFILEAEGTNDSIIDLSVFNEIIEITGNLVVSGTTGLSALSQEKSDGSYEGFTSLEVIGGNFFVGNENDITDLDSLGIFPFLSNIKGDLIAQNTSLNAIGNFSSLLDIGGDFLIDDNTSLKEVGNFSSLTEIKGNFEVLGNGSLGELAQIKNTYTTFTSLEEIRGHFKVNNNSGMSSIGIFPSLHLIGKDFIVLNNQSLKRLGDFGLLNYVVGDLVVNSNPLLDECCGLPTRAIGRARSISFSENASGCTSLTQSGIASFRGSASTCFVGNLVLKNQSDVDAVPLRLRPFAEESS